MQCKAQVIAVRMTCGIVRSDKEDARILDIPSEIGSPSNHFRIPMHMCLRYMGGQQKESN